MAGAAERTLEFNRDIRPILSENCFYCHGQDPKHREAKLRLDLPDEATRDLGGYAAVVPGKPQDSELLARILSEDKDEVMPPPKSNRHVTPEQRETLKRWIAQGAGYQAHWAFTPPKSAPLPAVKNEAWARTLPDRFVLARLEAEALEPAREARPETWLRRASFDLTGLPPTPAQLDAFGADVQARGETAYTAAADALLASPHFGERLAIDWLDVARYADTHGFNNDASRSMWRWRDWVIESFNANKPYDRFITEQLAGDLLPKATMEERLATGFGRNHVINSEGGIIEEEYRVEYVADRVRTTSLAWLGLTVECARCHDHKYDPITQRDYYKLFAFFNSVPEFGEDGRVANAVPMMPAPTHAQQAQLAANERELAALGETLNAPLDRWHWDESQKTALSEAIDAAQKARPEKDLTLYLDCETAEPRKDAWSFPGKAPELVDGIRGKAWSGGEAAFAKLEAKPIKFEKTGGTTVALWVRPAEGNPRDVALLSNQSYSGVPEGAGYGKGQEIRLVDGEIEVRMNDRFPAASARVLSEGAAIGSEAWRHVVVTYSGGVKAANLRVFVDGREVATRIQNDCLFGDPSGSPYLLGADASKDGPRFKGLLDEVRAYSRALDAPEIAPLFLADALPFARAKLEGGNASEIERAWVREACSMEAADGLKKRDALWQQYLALRRALPSAMVMVDSVPPRPSYILTRGNYDAHGEPVEPGVPEAVLGAWPKDAPRNRLGLARWLTQPENPMTSRVVVNRVWAQLFGTGLVKTLEDFGSQGEPPSHPELLDSLAREFVVGGWNLKALYQTLILSATYRQESGATPALWARDPENRLLARGPRVRLPAELIRDQALAVSGLLKEKLGGPSVHPYQPEGLYKGTVVGADYPGTQWTNSTGEGLYRRSLYTFWKRTVPYPSMLTFDAPDREFCTARRSRTNTPMQALVLLNDPIYLEASRELAARMLREGGSDDAARVAFAFRLATGRAPAPHETAVLLKALTRFRNEYANDEAGAKGLLKPGASPLDPTLPVGELAAATTVASMILNLDETITKN